MTRATVIVRRVNRRRRNRAFPAIEIDGYVRFRRESVRQWLAERECGTVPTPLRRSA